MSWNLWPVQSSWRQEVCWEKRREKKQQSLKCQRISKQPPVPCGENWALRGGLGNTPESCWWPPNWGLAPGTAPE